METRKLTIEIGLSEEAWKALKACEEKSGHDMKHLITRSISMMMGMVDEVYGESLNSSWGTPARHPHAPTTILVR
jgi:hypothetical protein